MPDAVEGPESYLADIDRFVARYKFHADKAMILFIIVRLMLTVLSAALPAFSANELSGYITPAAVAIAVLAALDTQFKWGDEWRHFRSAQLALQRIVRMYRTGAFCPELDPAMRFVKFVEDAELIMADDAKGFFKFRISEWKRNP